MSDTTQADDVVIDRTAYNAYGLTKRELFAAMAMQGYVSAAHRAPKELIVDDSIQLADALIAALNEGGEG